MNFRDVLFWVFLTLSMILLIWAVFGNSPTEFIALAALIFTVILKVWSISDRQLKMEMKFNMLARDFKQHIKHK